MLKLNHVDKYFNKGKKNQLHVINDTNLTFEDKGLVALLGPSGCGKTTLLNVIGGLDKIRKGTITINEEKISSRFISKVDRIRNLNIGYIFQDYKLIDNLSVYDNVAIVLKMIGIKDKKEINLRVEYVLERVGMLRYKSRPASMLSGGERQRVGIARAIAKDPDIILADEPTGNLDSKNTLEVMNIIKAISKDRLVILVTHEQDLAKFYASRIIEVEDGKVIEDYINNHDSELDYELDNCFYLKDFKNIDNYNSTENEQEISFYSNTREKVALDIVLRNGNIYIKSRDGKRIEVVDDNSGIEFIDGNRQIMNKDWVNQYQFNFKEIINHDVKKKYSSILNPITLLLNGFKSILDFPLLKKILLIGFLLAGMFIMYSTSSIAATLKVSNDDFVEVNTKYLEVIQNKIKVEDYTKYENNEFIDYLLPGDSLVNLSMPYDDYYQTDNGIGTLTGSLSDINTISDKDLVYGKMPTNNKEIVVDSLAISRMLDKNETFKMAGIFNIEDLLNRHVSLKNMEDLQIVGIVNLGSPSIYTDPSMFINIIANSNSDDEYYYREDEEATTEGTLLDYSLYKDSIEIKKGREPSNDYEVIVDISNQESMPLNKEINTKVNNKKLKVVGYYDSREGYTYYFVNNKTIKYNLINTKKSFTIMPKDNNKTIDYFRELNCNIKNTYEESKKNYLSEKKEEIKSTLIVSGIILAISLVEIFLMIRASFLSRIKEIGIFRAIGVKRIDIIKIFMGEIIAITTVAGIPGLIFMAYILNILSGISYLSKFIIVNPFVITISIIFVYLFNLIIGLIPVYHTIKKRPAYILSRHDLD